MINRPMVLAAAGAGVVVFVIASFLVFSGLERTAATLTIVSSIGAVAAALYRRFSPPRRETRQLTAEQKTILIDTVRQRWIGVRDDDGRLKGDGQLARDLAFPNEYQLMVSRENARQQDATHTIVEAWRRAEGHMILTGAPGSGKSVQLRLLVEWLLDRAEADRTRPVPIIIGLASWRPNDRAHSRGADDTPAFTHWLSETIQQTYGIGQESADLSQWISRGQMIVVLDGLDEVLPRYRAALFDDLATWIDDEHSSPTNWVMACRAREYAALETRLLESRRSITRRAATNNWQVRPLGDDQRISVLQQADDASDANWQPVIDAIREQQASYLTDSANDGVLATPLGLSIAVRAYNSEASGGDRDPSDLLDRDAGWDELWSTFVHERSDAVHVDPVYQADEQVDDVLPVGDLRRWLGTIAKGCMGHGRIVDPTRVVRPKRPRWAPPVVVSYVAAVRVGATIADQLTRYARSPMARFRRLPHFWSVVWASSVVVVGAFTEWSPLATLLAVTAASVFTGVVYAPMYVLLAWSATELGPSYLANLQRLFVGLEPTSLAQVASYPQTALVRAGAVLLVLRFVITREVASRRGAILTVCTIVAVVTKGYVAVSSAVVVALAIDYAIGVTASDWRRRTDGEGLVDFGLLIVLFGVTAVQLSPTIAAELDLRRLDSSLSTADGRWITVAAIAVAVAGLIGIVFRVQFAIFLLVMIGAAVLGGAYAWSDRSVAAVVLLAIIGNGFVNWLGKFSAARMLVLIGLAALGGAWLVGGIDLVPPDVLRSVGLQPLGRQPIIDSSLVGALAVAVVFSLTFVLLAAAFTLLLAAIRPMTRRYDSRPSIRSWLNNKHVPSVHLRWWNRGVPLGRGVNTNLAPPPKIWTDFLDLATYHGYLTRVGGDYYWTHEQLREWFAKYYADHARIAQLGVRRPSATAVGLRSAVLRQTTKWGVDRGRTAPMSAPSRDFLFRGRVATLSELAQGRPSRLSHALTARRLRDRIREFREPTNPLPTVQALVGPAGIGKSATVGEYVRRYGHKFDHVAWITGRDRSALRAGLIDWARDATGAPVDGLSLTQQQGIVRHRLKQSRESFLLIFDGIDDGQDIGGILPRELFGQLIVVTRSKDAIPPTADVIQLGSLRVDEAAEIFEAIAMCSAESQKADKVLSLLLDRPCTIRQFARLVADTHIGATEITEYVESYADKPISAVSDGDVAAAIASLAVRRVEIEENAEASALLRLLAVFASERIDLAAMGCDPKVSRLLVRHNVITAHGLALDHPLEVMMDSVTRSVVRRSMKAADVCSAIRYAEARLDSALRSSLAVTKPGHDRIRSHVYSITLLARDVGDGSAPIHLLLRLGALDFARGDYMMAHQTFVDAERIARQTYGDRDRPTLDAQSWLGAALLELGQSSDALAVLDRTLATQFRVLERFDRDIVRTHYYYARACRSAGDSSHGRSLLEDSVRVQKYVLQESWSRLAEAGYYAARANAEDGDSEASRAIAEDVLSIDAARLGRHEYLHRRAESLLADLAEECGDNRESLRRLRRCVKSWWDWSGSQRTTPGFIYEGRSIDSIEQAVAYKVRSRSTDNRLDLVDYRPDVVELKLRMATILARTGSIVGAYQWLLEALIAQRSMYGDDDGEANWLRSEVNALYSRMEEHYKEMQATVEWVRL